MKLIAMRYTCANCANVFDAPELDAGSYGEFLFRTRKGETAYMNGLEDPIYEQVDQYLAALPPTDALTASARSTILKEVFGEVACDPSPSGLAYIQEAQPPCPRCGSQAMASWTEKIPLEVWELDFPQVTHQQWNSLNEIEKRNLLRKAIASLPHPIV